MFNSLRASIFVIMAAMSLNATLVNTSFAAKKIDAAKEDLGDLQNKIQALKKELDNKQAAHKDATDALKDSETAISQANKKLVDINQKQTQNKNTLISLKKESLNINEKLSEQQKQLSILVRQQYVHGNQSYTKLLLQNKNPSQISRDIQYYSYIAKAHAQLIDEMQASLAKVKILNNETAATLQAVADLKAKQLAERKTLEQQKSEKSKVVKSLSGQISAKRNEIKKLKRDEQNLSQLVERLAKIIAKPPKKVVKRKAVAKKSNDPDSNTAEAKPSSQTIAKNEETPTNAYAGSNFSALKGKLNLPVRGDVTNRFGSSRSDTGVLWKGLFIRANEGSDVKSVASGRVVFADWMRGFGNLIIVDHGSGYMSLYGNNQAVLKQVGDEVSAGDNIAAVGNSGGNESNGLYYELRRQSKPFDPLSWSVVR
ncbi:MULTISPECIES: murein hydrolase activator EnvC family protein [Methylotenera]|uniref:murein hydrolase activator EnvC family protein n=1 Tax=Methylotenera TaxID=359407 RepID=UPI0003705CF6|nr:MULTISPECIES: peptidoglycan DD-metalloendopeptidase family protein [Methylotenera]